MMIVASDKPGHIPTLVCWAVVMLLCGLTRPEGNIYNFFLICTYFLINAAKFRMVIAPSAIVIFIVYALPGISYFLWRFDYFGHLWPLPFYVKGLYAESALDKFSDNILKSAVHLLFPLMALGLTFLFPRGTQGKFNLSAKMAVSVILFLVFYMFMGLSQNIVFRFQYPIFILLLFLAVYRMGEWITLPNSRCALPFLIIFPLAALWFSVSAIPIPDAKDEVIALGKDLEPLARQGRTLAVSEAGRLPYFSKWRTLDSYGLNDPTVVKGDLDFAYWKSFSPDLVMIRAGWDIYANAVPDKYSSGNRKVFMEFLRKDSFYELIAVVDGIRRTGSVNKDYRNLYFVSKESPAYQDIRTSLENIPGTKYSKLSPVISKYLEGS